MPHPSITDFSSVYPTIPSRLFDLTLYSSYITIHDCYTINTILPVTNVNFVYLLIFEFRFHFCYHIFVNKTQCKRYSTPIHANTPPTPHTQFTKW